MSRGGQEMFKRIENSQKPFLAAINGPALGGEIFAFLPIITS